MRTRDRGLALPLIVAAGAIVPDVLLLDLTLAEGTYYVEKVWNASATLIVVWAVLFASWQILAAITTVVAIQD